MSRKRRRGAKQAGGNPQVAAKKITAEIGTATGDKFALVIGAVVSGCTENESSE